jgi:adenine-specific DNA-methyltransferase
MATGISKSNWNKTTLIVSDEEFLGSTDFEITYSDKLSETEILVSEPHAKYCQIYHGNSANELYFGDNIDVMRHLLKNEKLSSKVKLVYIDPPYGTNSVFQSRHQKSSYKDDLIGSHYIEFIRRRVILLRELLADDGSIYVHLDSNMAFQIKVLMDEIFGAKNFRGFITRKKCSNKNYTKKTYGNISDYIVFYSKGDDFTWHRPIDSWNDEKIIKEYPCVDAKTGRRFKKVPIHAPGARNGDTGKEWRGKFPPQGKHWQYTPATLDQLDLDGDIYWSKNGNPRRKVYFDEDKGIPIQDIWLDVQDAINQNVDTTGYPTEKNPSLIERIIKASSNLGDIILDCFAGSGTTLAIANQLNRRWIGIDNSSEAMDYIFRRFFKGIEPMGNYVNDLNAELISQSQQSIFDESVSVYKKKELIRNFTFYSDARYSEQLEKMIKLYY